MVGGLISCTGMVCTVLIGLARVKRGQVLAVIIIDVQKLVIYGAVVAQLKI